MLNRTLPQSLESRHLHLQFARLHHRGRPAFRPHKSSVVILFSGSGHSPNSLKFYLESVGFVVYTFDTLDGMQYDLTDDAVWDPLYAQLQSGKFIAAFISLPCGTFSRVRQIPGGPPHLRGVDASRGADLRA